MAIRPRPCQDYVFNAWRRCARSSVVERALPGVQKRVERAKQVEHDLGVLVPVGAMQREALDIPVGHGLRHLLIAACAAGVARMYIMWS